MNKLQKQRYYERIEQSEVDNVITMYIQDDCNSVRQIRLPEWMDEALVVKIGKKAISAYIRKLIFDDFNKRGIKKPATSIHNEILEKEMEGFQ
jgi:hypothetical protein